MIRFLRCFAEFRRLEDDLTEARITVGTERELRIKAEAEAHRMWSAYEDERRGHTDALKMLNNVAIQTSVGCLPPHPEVWSLPQRKPKPVDFEPIESGRVNPGEAVRKANDSFIADVIEFWNNKQAS